MLKSAMAHQNKLGSPVCPNCKQIFSSKESKNVFISHHPMLLTCGHSICLSCVLKAQSSVLKQQKSALIQPSTETCNVTCPLCENSTELPQNFISFGGSDVEPNYYLFGWLESKRRTFLRVEPNFTFLPAGASLNDRKSKRSTALVTSVPDRAAQSLQEPQDEETCLECLSASAQCYCQNCSSHYCDTCFSKVHIHRTTSHHKKMSVTSVHSMHSPPGNYWYPRLCPSHPQCSIEYFCQDDDQLMCTNCVSLAAHKGHIPVKLETQNEEYGRKLRKLEPCLKDVLNNLTFSKQATERLIDSNRSNLDKMVQKTKEQFLSFHSILQLAEKDALSKLEESCNQEIEALASEFEHFKSNQRELQTLKQIIESQGKDPIRGVINFGLVQAEIERILEMPSCLLVKEGEQLQLAIPGTNNTPSFEVEFGDVKAFSERLFTIKPKTEGNVWKVVPLRSLSEAQKTQFEQLIEPEQPVLELPQTPGCSDDLGIAIPLGHTVASAPSRIHESLVKMTHLVDPLEFYVRRVRDEPLFLSLIEQLQEWAESAFSQPCLTQIFPSKVYGMRNPADNSCRRLRVTCGTQSIARSPHKSQLIEGQCIDSGEPFVVPVSAIRELPQRLLANPSLVLHCSLDNIIPTEGVRWVPSHIRQFKQLLGNEKLTLVEVRTEGSLNYVDLVTREPFGIQNKSSMAVRDTLVHLGIARYRNMNTLHRAVEEPSKKYALFDPDIRVGEKKVGLVSYVCTPHNFYVQLVSGFEQLMSLSEDLQRYYNQGNIAKMWAILHPRKGTLCVAQFSKDDLWYRAQIEDVCDPRTAFVRYVDYGNTEKLDVSKLRTINEKFLALPAMAISCKLAHVNAKDNKGSDSPGQTQRLTWTNAHMHRFLKLTLHKEFLLEIVGIHEGGVGSFCFFPKPTPQYQLIVNLTPFQKGVVRQTKVIPINQVLAAEGFAVYESVGSMMEENPCPMVSKKPKPKRKPFTSDQMSMRLKVRESIAELEKFYAQAEAVTYPSNLPELEYSNDELNPPMKVEEDSEVSAPVENTKRVEVSVLDCESPGSIVVRILKLEPSIERMMERLQQLAPEENVPKKWNIGDLCMLRTEEHYPWQRGKIQTLEEARGTAKVFLIDAGRTLGAVPCEELFPLPVDFNRFPTSALRVHLAGVQPAGGAKWTFLSKENIHASLNNPFIKHRYIEKQGEPVNESIPVHFYCEIWHQGGALKPDVVQTHFLNQELLDQGLALPIKGCGFLKESLSFDVIEQSFENPLPTLLPVDRRLETLPQKTWLRTKTVQKKMFKVTPTWVDMKGRVYLQDRTQGECLANMQAVLDAEFAGSEAEPEDTYWFPGQMCSVRYDIDDHWHRGEVLEVQVEEQVVGVELVDYGTQIDVDRKKLRKTVLFTDVPLQVRRCILFNLIPDNGTEWDYDTLDFLHKLIVDRECLVMVQEMGEILKVKLSMLSNGLNIGELLVNTGGAKWECLPQETDVCESFEDVEDADIDVSISSSVQPRSLDEEAGNDGLGTDFCQSFEFEGIGAVYRPLLVPQGKGVSFLAQVTAVASANEVWLQPVQPFALKADPNPDLIPFVNTWTEHLRVFLELLEKLKLEAHTFPNLSNVKPGMVCCAVFEGDQFWYRGLVEAVNVDDKGTSVATVVFVDYGNVETVSLDKLRFLPGEFLQVPMFAVKTYLPYQLEASDDTKSVELQLAQLLGKNFQARIQSVQPLVCELIGEEGSDEVVLYKNLVESDMVKPFSNF